MDEELYDTKMKQVADDVAKALKGKTNGDFAEASTVLCAVAAMYAATVPRNEQAKWLTTFLMGTLDFVRQFNASNEKTESEGETK